MPSARSGGGSGVDDEGGWSERKQGVSQDGRARES